MAIDDTKAQHAPRTAIYDRPDTVVNVNETSDLVRWGPVLAGIFAALATLITLTVLGLAIGLSAYDPTRPLGGFGIGAGIGGAITALAAFLVGGWVAGRSASYSGRTSGIMQGAMVWFVTIPLLIYMIGGGIGALVNTAGNVVGTAANVTGQVVGGAANDPSVKATAQAAPQDPALQATAQAVGSSVQATAQAIATPQNVDRATNAAGNAAWGILLSLGLAAGAAILGGYLGAQQPTRRSVARV